MKATRHVVIPAKPGSILIFGVKKEQDGFRLSPE
jgi:hypothetical protein